MKNNILNVFLLILLVAFTSCEDESKANSTDNTENNAKQKVVDKSLPNPETLGRTKATIICELKDIINNPTKNKDKIISLRKELKAKNLRLKKLSTEAIGVAIQQRKVFRKELKSCQLTEGKALRIMLKAKRVK